MSWSDAVDWVGESDTHSRVGTNAVTAAEFQASCDRAMVAAARGIVGFLEKVGCDSVRGLVGRTAPDVALTIDLDDGDHLLAIAIADQFRQDLLGGGKG